MNTVLLVVAIVAAISMLVGGAIVLRRRCWACGVWNRGPANSCRNCGMPAKRPEDHAGARRPRPRSRLRRRGRVRSAA